MIGIKRCLENENYTDYCIHFVQHNLEFELRLQQYIELVRSQDQTKKIEAIAHAKKYLVTNQETQNKEIMRAAGMLVFTQDTRAEPYQVSQSIRESKKLVTRAWKSQLTFSTI